MKNSTCSQPLNLSGASQHRVKGQRLTVSAWTTIAHEKKISYTEKHLHTTSLPPTHAQNTSLHIKLLSRVTAQITRWFCGLESCSGPGSGSLWSTHSEWTDRSRWGWADTRRWCVRESYLVEAVHCRPPLAVRVQYFPAAVRNAHFLFSRQISTWNTSWSPSSSWLADRSIPEWKPHRRRLNTAHVFL